MTTTPAPKSVFCHMVSEEVRQADHNDWSAGQIDRTIYASKQAALEDLKWYVSSLLCSDSPEVSDYTDDADHPRVEWTSASTGKRMCRFIAALPFVGG